MRANHTEEGPLWLRLLLARPVSTLIFAEGEGEGDGGEGGEGAGDGAGDQGDSGDTGDDSGDDSGDSGDDGDGDGDDDSKRDTSGLKSALQKERKERRKFEKEAKRLAKAEQERADAEKTEVERANDQAERAKETNAKLATRLRETAVDHAIESAASKLKFQDPEDALALIKRTEIGVEQDEDDPSDIQIDAKSVETAVKELAKKKPHLLVAEGDDLPSGSSFGGGRKKKDALDEASLKETYPALR